MRFLLVCPFVLASLSQAQIQKGLVITKIGARDNAYAVAVQPDGKIVAAGVTYRDRDSAFALVRYLSDGTPDKNFGVNGRVTTKFGSGDDKAYALAVQKDGRILVGGSAYNGKDTDYAVARYRTDGSPDATFGTGGATRVDVAGGDDRASGIVVTPAGVIYVAGTAHVGKTNDFAIVALSSTGELHPGFGTLGKVTTEFGTGDDYAYGVALQNDGRLVVAGHSMIGDSNVFTVARYLPNGTLDASWGSGQGRVYTSIGPYNDNAYAVTLQGDGKVLVAGSSSNGKDQDFAVVRYLNNGSLDPDFGAEGKVRTPMGPGIDNIYGVAVQANGKIVAAGSYFNGFDFDIAVVRYETTGRLDSTFGAGGKVGVEMAYRYDAAYSVALQKDGKVLVGGVTNDSVNYGFAVARFTNNGKMDGTFHGDVESQTLVARGMAASDKARYRQSITAEAGLKSLLNLMPPTK
ncbi:MAG: hypothetical protein HYR96_14435 [Deltaproteobacteria bacterium]|nr:hypothetical protein [Deltaproteobacteria bacterium]MBI3296349.1 hypothetical protein [Deltaproteobacteria bacterium]